MSEIIFSSVHLHMIQFEKFEIANGLKVLVHQDVSTPMAVVNVLYDVGARDEDPAKTGFAHLFEHLMFGGSVNIPSYDEPLQLAGGDNNAFHIVTKDGVENWPESAKDVIARKLMEKVAHELAKD